VRSGLGIEDVANQFRTVFNGVPVYCLCRIFELCQKNLDFFTFVLINEFAFVLINEFGFVLIN
jgi:hypothetical protein